MWCLISLIAASHEVLSCPPSQDGSPAHTNLHTELNLQTNSLFSPLWGLWVGTHVRHSMCKSNANLSFYVFLWPCFVGAWMLLALCKLELMSNLKSPPVGTELCCIIPCGKSLLIARGCRQCIDGGTPQICVFPPQWDPCNVLSLTILVQKPVSFAPSECCCMNDCCARMIDGRLVLMVRECGHLRMMWRPSAADLQ